LKNTARSYFASGDLTKNCLIYFDSKAPPRILPVSTALPHLRKFGATGIILQLQNYLEDVAERELGNGGTTWNDILDETYGRPEKIEDLGTLHRAAKHENMTVNTRNI
jgi:hypothetical protein